MLAGAGAEVIVIAWLMNLCQAHLLEIMGGVLVVIPTMEVEPEEFDFKRNLHDNA